MPGAPPREGNTLVGLIWPVGSNCKPTTAGRSQLQKMNDLHTKRKNNVAVFNGRARATRAIAVGEELTQTYGAGYWRKQRKVLLNTKTRACAQRAVDQAHLECVLAIKFAVSNAASWCSETYRPLAISTSPVPPDNWQSTPVAPHRTFTCT